MMTDRFSNLLGKVNRNPFLGHKDGTLIVVEHRCGGGFAGAPEVLVLREITKKELEELEDKRVNYESEYFPEPSPSVEYRLGGYCAHRSLFTPYQYNLIRQQRQNMLHPAK